MSFSDEQRSKSLCLNLLHAETEDEVVHALQEQNLWDDRSVWRPYGDISNNRGIVGNQQSSPVAALVEKLVNSIDAVLTAECYQRGINPKGPHAPQTMREAVSAFFNVREGRIENLTAGERTNLAERIQLVATGRKTNPCYLIIDDGEGQSPQDFPETFLSLLRDNKTGIPFVQGKYNMGGTGVLQFAGKHSFQLVLSRRQPYAPPGSRESETDDRWGFTLIRRLDAAPDQPHTTYTYLAPDGRILAFRDGALPLRPGRYPEAHVHDLEAGTCIKLWDYKLPGGLKTLATLDLRRAVETHLQDPALPIRICERRQGYRAHYYNTTMSGLSAVITDNDQNIEPGMDTGSPLEVAKVGTVTVRVVVMREDVGRSSYPSGLFFSVNGQLHSRYRKDYFSRRAKLDYVADSMIVMADCSAIPSRTREDVFLASRDRMRDCSERDALFDAIFGYLRDHPGLKELNARRRQARLASALSEEETAAVIQQLVRSDPTLANLFGRGQHIRVPVGPLPEPEPYVGQQFPTYFRIAKEPRGGLIKRCPCNRTSRVPFETDAANDYLSRANDPGRMELRGAMHLVSTHLWNGKAVLRFAPPANCNVGDKLSVDLLVMDVSRAEPLRSRFIVEIDHEADPRPPGPPPPLPGALLTGLPNIIEVRRDEWARYEFDEKTAIDLKTGEDDALDIFVNMDNIYLRNEIARRRTTDPMLLNYWFKYGLCLHALGMLYQQRQTSTEGNEQEVNVNGPDGMADIVTACRGLAVTVIPVISQLSHGRERAEHT